MFESLKKNIQSVQYGITAGLQRLSVGEQKAAGGGGGGGGGTVTPSDTHVNLSAGSDLLQMYQTQWATMHHLAEQNSTVALELDAAIKQLADKCDGQHSQMAEIHSLLAHLPNIMAQLHSMLATIGSMRGLFEEVEGGILTLQDLDEELSLQEQILDLRLSLALAREKHTHSLNNLQCELKAQHQSEIMKIEKRKESDRIERERVFSEKFNEDIKNYIDKGQIRKRITSSDGGGDGDGDGGDGDGDGGGLTLEEVTLDQDSSALDDFLNE